MTTYTVICETFGYDLFYILHYSSFRVCSISPKNVPRINLFLHIIQASIIPVGNDGMALALESIQIIHHFAAEERAAIFECRFIDDDLRTFGLDAFHHTLNARLAEVVRVRFHRQAVHADDTLPLLGRIEVSTVVVVVVTGRVQYAVGNEILARAVTFHYGLDEVFRDILVIGQQLLGVFGQAVAAVTRTKDCCSGFRFAGRGLHRR